MKSRKADQLVVEALKELLEMGFTNFEKNVELCMKHKC
jgi:hypothetical protein